MAEFVIKRATILFYMYIAYFVMTVHCLLFSKELNLLQNNVRI